MSRLLIALLVSLGLSLAQDPIVIQLGEQVETLSTFNARFEIAMRSVALSQGLELTDDIRAQLEPFKPQFLEQRGTELVLLQTGTELGLSVPEAVIDEQIAQINASLAEGESLEDFLALVGFADEAALRSYLRENALIEQTVNLLRAEIELSEAALIEAYEANLEAFRTPEQVCAQHILVDEQALADELMAELAAGAEFAELAQTHSQDPGSAARGGDLGCFGRGQMVPEFEAAAFEAASDEIAVAESQFGIHLIRVYERQEAGVAPFEAVVDELRFTLEQQALAERIEALVDEAELRLFPENL